jgi:hypothetical protein
MKEEFNKDMENLKKKEILEIKRSLKQIKILKATPAN